MENKNDPFVDENGNHWGEKWKKHLTEENPNLPTPSDKLDKDPVAKPISSPRIQVRQQIG